MISAVSGYRVASRRGKLGLRLSVVATGFPDLVYLLLASALVALGWAVVKAIWTYAALRAEQAA